MMRPLLLFCSLVGCGNADVCRSIPLGADGTTWLVGATPLSQLSQPRQAGSEGIEWLQGPAPGLDAYANREVVKLPLSRVEAGRFNEYACAVWVRANRITAVGEYYFSD